MRFDATNVRGTCLWCGRKLQKRRREHQRPGVAGMGHFDTLDCGWRFALHMADNGHRLQPLTADERAERLERDRKRERAAAE